MKTAERRLELLAEEGDGLVRLLSPAVGVFTCARSKGRVLTPGEPAGVLLQLGVPHELVTPARVTGRISTPPPERVHEPVAFRQLLYDLEPLSADVAREVAAEAEAAGAQQGLFFRAPHSGRYWQRAAPGEPPLCKPGDLIHPGSNVGVIEVMKTFTHLHYEERDDLPAQARVLRHLVEDGTEVAEGEPLIELEPA